MKRKGCRNWTRVYCCPTQTVSHDCTLDRSCSKTGGPFPTKLSLLNLSVRWTGLDSRAVRSSRMVCDVWDPEQNGSCLKQKLAPLVRHAMQHTSILILCCSLSLSICEPLGSIECCTAPFALGGTQVLGFTSQHLTDSHAEKRHHLNTQGRPPPYAHVAQDRSTASCTRMDAVSSGRA